MKITLKNFEFLNTLDVLRGLGSQTFSLETSEAILTTLEEIEAALKKSFYDPQAALLDVYAQKKDGELVYTNDTRTRVELQKGKETEYQEKVVALSNSEVSVEIETPVTKADLVSAEVKLSLAQVSMIRPYFKVVE
jgi:hypothetical protein